MFIVLSGTVIVKAAWACLLLELPRTYLSIGSQMRREINNSEEKSMQLKLLTNHNVLVSMLEQ